ncbi:metallophosphoesterase [bacterium]|nr:MAG: metallophosphoesterase [bacterium]
MQESNLNRRNFLSLSALAAGATLLNMDSPASAAAPVAADAPVLTILHMTDTHIRPEHDAPARCQKILAAILKNHPDINLVLNTGDSIYAADYGHITRERVEEQWKIWDETVMPLLKGLPILHAIGNHDPWWAGPEGDAMVGYPYVCKRLGIESPYYATRRGGWEIIVLNNSKASVDADQLAWLEKTLTALPPNAPLLLATHVPIFSLAGTYDSGNMSGGKKLVDLLAPRTAAVVALSGHIHIQSSESLWNIRFHCNGALSGSWWEPGEQQVGSYKRTPMGYAIVRLWADGRSDSQYHPVPYK